MGPSGDAGRPSSGTNVGGIHRPTRSRRRRRSVRTVSIRRVITNNLSIKIGAVFLAVVLWLFAKGEQTVDRAFPIPLVLRNLPEDLTTFARPPESILVVLTGANKELVKLSLWGEPYAFVDMAGAESGQVFRVSLSAANIVLPRDAEVQVAEVRDPKNLDLEIDVLAERRVRVEPLIEGEPAEGYFVFGAPRALPDSVTIFGPRSMVRRMTTVRARTLDISSRRARIEIARPVDLEGSCNLHAVPKETRIIVDIEGTKIVEIPGVPVTFEHDPGHRSTSIEPAWIAVRASGPEHVVQGLAPADISALVDARGLPKGTHQLVPEIEAPEDVVVAEATPLRLTVTLE